MTWDFFPTISLRNRNLGGAMNFSLLSWQALHPALLGGWWDRPGWACVCQHCCWLQAWLQGNPAWWHCQLPLSCISPSPPPVHHWQLAGRNLKAGTMALKHKSLHTRVQGQFVGGTATQMITLASDYSTQHSPCLRDVNETLFTGCTKSLILFF